MNSNALALVNGSLAAVGNSGTYTSGVAKMTNTIDYGQYTSQWFGYPWYPYYPPQRIEVEPTTCKGKAHVFACDHEPKCLCGKIHRVMPRPKKAT